jgi:hypothetical protein
MGLKLREIATFLPQNHALVLSPAAREDARPPDFTSRAC